MDDTLFIFLILLIFSLVIFSIDILSPKNIICFKSANKNKKYKIFILLLSHHILQVFTHFGWIFNNKKILVFYIILPFLTLYHWKTNNNTCTLTENFNKLCNKPKGTLFNDIFKLLGMKKYNLWNNYLHYAYLFFVIFIALYKINSVYLSIFAYIILYIFIISKKK